MESKSDEEGSQVILCKSCEGIGTNQIINGHMWVVCQGCGRKSEVMNNGMWRIVKEQKINEEEDMPVIELESAAGTAASAAVPKATTASTFPPGNSHASGND